MIRMYSFLRLRYSHLDIYILPVLLQVVGVADIIRSTTINLATT